MKKLLLTGAMLLALTLTVKAQETFSFETSEGFDLGPIEGQNEFGADGDIYQIVSDDATDGDNSLLIGTTNTALGTNVTAGVYSPALTLAGDVVFSFDIKLSELGEEAANFFIAPQAPSQEMVTSRMGFFNDGQVAIVKEGDDGELGYYLLGTVSEDGTEFTPFEAEAGQWYNVRMEHYFSEDIIGYFIDDELLQTSTIWAGDAVENFVILSDNLNSTANVDNISLSAPVAGFKKNNLSQVSVYPNPTSNVVNIAKAGLVNNVAISDLNGRTVKSAKFDGVANAQLNIADLASGVYMMTISSDKGTTTKKIVKN